MTRMVSVLTLAVALAAAGDASAAKVWFTSGEQFRTVPRHASTPRAALEALLAGPSAAERRRDVETQIPAGVALRSVRLADGVARVTFSPRFARASGRAALGQVAFTATQFAGVRSVTVRAGDEVLATRLARSAYARPDTYTPPPSDLPPKGSLRDAKTVKLQQRLADLGYLPADAVDGIAGYRTSQAVMAFQAWEGLGRDGVAGPLTTARLQKAKRPVPFATGPSRRIEVDRARGVALTVVGNRVERAIHVSTGAGVNATPAGTFRVFRKELRSWSVPYKVWLPYASYFNNGVAFHEYADVPAYPASHGCVRTPAPEAPYLYAFAANGTTVVVR
ncbi:MAG: L,D-transpeptidase family protein [Solirubrobacteraceae bacterium]